MYTRIGTLLVGVLLLQCAGATAARSRLLAAGWAPGGDPARPTSQDVADRTHMPAYCAGNSVLLFRVRGSGDGYGNKDKLSGWTRHAGEALIKRGWNVRDIQAIYSAPPVPLSLRPSTWQHYRTVETREAPLVEGQLVRTYNRCKQRSILLAGYSQGAIILREIVPYLPPALRAQIKRIDLIADPTEDSRVDSNLSDSGPPPMRLTDGGLDTAAGRLIHAGHFHQTPYPKDLASRVHQYCVTFDVVCDFNPSNFSAVNLAGELARHGHYPWGAIGDMAGTSLPDLTPIRTIRCNISYGSLYETVATNTDCATAGRVWTYGEQVGLANCNSFPCSFSFDGWSCTDRPKQPEGSIETCLASGRRTIQYFSN